VDILKTINSSHLKLRILYIYVYGVIFIMFYVGSVVYRYMRIFVLFLVLVGFVYHVTENMSVSQVSVR
jgi:uncharacterized membrane protein